MSRHHPLQRFSSPSRGFSTAIHILGLISFSASFAYLEQFPTPLCHGFGGNYQFLTIIGLAMAMATFAIGLLADLTLSRRLFDLKNVFSVCSAPLEVLISVLYWGLCAIDPSLVVPPELALPLLPDFGFHAMPAIMLSIDLLLLSPPWTIKAYGALTVSMVIAFMYWFWIEYCFSINGWYPYPLLGLLATWQRVLLFSGSAVVMTGSTMALKWAYGTVNGVLRSIDGSVNRLKTD